MSKYTTEVRFICEHYAGLDESRGYDSIRDIIVNSRSKVFDFDYPIFDEAYRSVLETKILKHFYLREICAETVGAWKHFLDMRMNEIMPYYNKLYESELIEFNPMYDVDYDKTYNKDGKGTGTVNEALTANEQDARTVAEAENVVRDLDTSLRQTGTLGMVGETHTSTDRDTDHTGTEGDVKKNTRWDIYSDTPQGGLVNVENEEYLTNARKIVDDGTGSLRTVNLSDNTDEDTDTTYSQTETRNLTDTGTEDETTNRTRNTTDNENRTKNNTNLTTRNLRDIEDYVEHVQGKMYAGSYSKLLQEFRDTFLNIDMMIINDLNDLFFGLW